MTGCFYIPPAERPQPNEPPRRISPLEDQVVPIILDRQPFVAEAVDPEGGALDFRWSLRPNVRPVTVQPVESDGNGKYISTAFLDRDPLLDGASLVVRILDDRNQVIEMTWLLQVEGQ